MSLERFYDLTMRIFSKCFDAENIIILYIQYCYGLTIKGGLLFTQTDYLYPFFAGRVQVDRSSEKVNNALVDQRNYFCNAFIKSNDFSLLINKYLFIIKMNSQNIFFCNSF